MRRRRQSGQAMLMAAMALGIFLIGAVGLAIDTSQLYINRHMAQVAADAAAQAAILSIYNGTNVGSNAFASTASYTHTCSTTDTITPCAYARKNRFGSTARDTVTVDVPTAAAVGLDPASLSTTDPIALIRVTISRNVSTWLIPMIGGATSATVGATAVAAVVGVDDPVPILVTHPSLPASLSLNGNTSIRICGGPTKSIQVNSANIAAFGAGGKPIAVDLRKAGPADTNGTCTTGTGADFGVWGGAATNPGNVALGTTGNYVSPASAQADPLARRLAQSWPSGRPPVPTTVRTGPTQTITTVGLKGCNTPPCSVYSPGLYVGGLSIKNSNPVIFEPGLYYIQGGGFTLKGVDGGGGGPNFNAMCVGCPADTNTGTGMVVYDTGPAGSTLFNNPTGGFQIDTNVNVSILGSTLTTTNAQGHIVPTGPYWGLLFWEDSTANAHIGNQAHGFGQGNGCFTLTGTIYVTNPVGVMSATHYQQIKYNGNPCSNTIQQGNIITSALEIVGSTNISMNLNQFGYLSVRKIALVK